MTPEEEAALASILASDGLPLTESDVDKLAEQFSEGRLIPKRRTNFHE